MIGVQQDTVGALSVQLKHKGHRIAIYRHPDGASFGFSIFPGGGSKGNQVTSLMSRKGFASADAATAAALQAVDLATQAGVSGIGAIDGFSFGSIGKVFDKIGQGAADNAGIIGTVGGAVVGAIGGPAGIAAGMAAGGALGKTVQGSREAQKEKKAADAEKQEAEKQAAAAEAAAAKDAAAAAASAPAGETALDRALAKAKGVTKGKTGIIVAAGAGGLVILGLGLWLILRKRK